MNTHRIQSIAITKTRTSEFDLIRRLAVLTIVAVAVFCQLRASNALAQPHGGHAFSHGPPAADGPSFSHGRSFAHAPSFSHAPFQTRNFAFDGRFNHDHFYPAVGNSVRTLPPGRLDLTFGRGHYFFHAGVWYGRRGPNFVVVRPPLGIIVPILPPTFATVMVTGIPYYYANDIYYVAVPDGYQVVAPPADTVMAQSSQPAAASSPTANSSYYCESTQSYYPSVSHCKEGWRVLSATPQS